MKVDQKTLEDLYATNPNIRSIAKQLGMSYSSLHDRFKRMGLTGKGVVVQNIEVSELIELYESGYSVHSIGKVYGVNGKIVYTKLRKARIKFRRAGNTVELNHRYFEILNGSSKEYWLGVICGDGCVFKNKVQIGVQANDAAWVGEFLKEVQSNISASFNSNDWSGACHISINSEKMVSDLMKLGITERKSKTLDCPVSTNSFWRGVLDADGSIYIGANGSNYVNAITSGSPKFAKRCSDNLKKLKLDFKEYDNNGIKTIRLFGLEGKKYLDWLYAGSNERNRLERKYLNYQLYLGNAPILKEGFKQVPFLEAVSFIAMNHYLKTCKPSKTYGWYVGGELVAVAAISSCSGPTVAKTVYKDNVSRVRELHRFCIDQKKAPKNLGSMFLAEVLRQYAMDYLNIWAVVSYADSAQGHEGTIYKAVSAKQLSSPNKAELVVVLPNGLCLTGRDDVVIDQIESAGYSVQECRLEKSAGKNKFVMFLGSGKQKSDRFSMMNK